jgi:tRNA (mo5U34)-methyltransferase
MMDTDALRAEMSGIDWFHSIPLGNGLVTPGVDRSTERLAEMGIPDDLTGKTVLDIGAWDGFFSFEAERRGASRVLATDSFCWSGEGWGTKAGFDLARRALGSKVEDREIDVLDLSPQTVGVFDVVLFLGVLYHMRHPLLALERVAAVTRELLVLDTHVDLLGRRRPALTFYPGRELAGDPTNWWGPNPLAVASMLRSVRFERVVVFKPPASRRARMTRAAKTRARGGRFFPTLAEGRMTFHAWK